MQPVEYQPYLAQEQELEHAQSQQSLERVQTVPEIDEVDDVESQNSTFYGRSSAPKFIPSESAEPIVDVPASQNKHETVKHIFQNVPDVKLRLLGSICRHREEEAIVVMIDNIPLTCKDFKSLLNPTECLNDVVSNILFLQFNNRQCFTT